MPPESRIGVVDPVLNSTNLSGRQIRMPTTEMNIVAFCVTTLRGHGFDTVVWCHVASCSAPFYTVSPCQSLCVPHRAFEIFRN